MEQNKKVALLYIIEILKKYSDEDHPLTQQDILKYLSSNYEIELDRKTVSASIKLLSDFGYDIINGDNGKGCYLGDRNFNPSETKYLIDAIFSSKCISANIAKQLVEKLSSELSVHQQKDYKYLYKTVDVNRTNNNEVFVNIEIITEAIRKNKWIEFRYTYYDMDGKQKPKDYTLHVSPCYLINNFGQYYLLGKKSNYDDVSTFRLDKMVEVKIFTQRNRVDPKELEEFKDGKSVSDYLNDHIYMYGGHAIDAKLKLKDAGTISFVMDWFGKNAKFHKEDGELYCNIKCNEQALYFWCLQYSDSVQLIEPKSVVEKLLNTYSMCIDKYKKSLDIEMNPI